MKEDPQRLEHFSTLYEVLKEYMGEAYLPNAIELLGIYGRVSKLSYLYTICLFKWEFIHFNWCFCGILNQGVKTGLNFMFKTISIRIQNWTNVILTIPELNDKPFYSQKMHNFRQIRDCFIF